jgi:hypothetical protein
MRNNYTCIGAFISIDGLSMVRFDLLGTQYRILETIVEETMPSYYLVVKHIEDLSNLGTETVFRMDVLTNFETSLKSYVLNNHKSQHIIRIRTTPQDSQNQILNLRNIISQERLIVYESDKLAIKALQAIKNLNRKSLFDLYQNNLYLNSTLEALLHSVSWLDSQLIKHKLI